MCMNKKMLLIRPAIYFAFLAQSLSFLSACGVNTKTWPHITFSFSVDDVLEVTVFYERNANKYLDYIKDTITINKKDAIESVLDTIKAYPYKEAEEKDADETNYCSMIKVKIAYFENSEEKNENIRFYEYGVSNCKVILNDGTVHNLPGDISTIYNIAKEKR